MNEIFRRVSVREFTGQAVEPDKVELLLRAAMQAPSAGNQQPWEFVVVDERPVLDALVAMSPYTGPLKTAALCIVVLERSAGLRFAGDTPSDLSAATQNILLEAVALGLGACWLGTWPERDRMAVVKQALGVPEGLEPYSLIAIGYPAAGAEREAAPRYDAERVRWNRY